MKDTKQSIHDLAYVEILIGCQIKGCHKLFEPSVEEPPTEPVDDWAEGMARRAMAAGWSADAEGRVLCPAHRLVALVPDTYPVVGRFKNETTSEMTLYLELIPEEVILSPGDEVELLARPGEGLLPLSVERVEDGFHIHAHKVLDPDWHVRFRGKIIKARTPTRLDDHRSTDDKP